MSDLDFSDFFAKAFTDGRVPYDYQCRLAELPCESRLINIPTGLGKTAAVVLAWLYNRVYLKSEKWPRRFASSPEAIFQSLRRTAAAMLFPIGHHDFRLLEKVTLQHPKQL